jgi:HK97 family phage major capsid protein
MEKELVEKRNKLVEEMEGLINGIKKEKRAFNDDENKKMGEIKKEIEGIDNTLKTLDETRDFSKTEVKEKKDKKVEQRALDEKNFLDFCRGEKRALDTSTNGGIIPTTIANQIIEKVKELSPIYSMATIYNVKGTLVFPVYDETSSSVSANYTEDLTELTEGTGKFTTVELKNYIVGSLAKISQSLINQTDFDLLGYIVNKVAQAIANFLEHELIVGTTNKLTGVLSAVQNVESNTAGKIDTDDIIDLMDQIPEIYQANACFIMNKSTRNALRKLKFTGTGEYVLQRDVTSPFGFTVFGKPVYITESMPVLEAGNKAIVYGDMSGLAVKLTKDVQIQVLQEKYATQHATGVVAYVELDSKIIDNQKIATLTVKAEAGA